MITQPNLNLFDRVLFRIEQEEKLLKLKKSLILNIFSFCFSLILFIPFSLKLRSDFAMSGTTDFLSLMFTDFSIIISNINDYLFTLLESIPALTLALVLSAFAALIFTGKRAEQSYISVKKLTSPMNSRA